MEIKEIGMLPKHKPMSDPIHLRIEGINDVKEYATTAENALSNVPGVSHVRFILSERVAVVSFLPGHAVVPTQKLLQAVQDVGLDASLLVDRSEKIDITDNHIWNQEESQNSDYNIELYIGGMMCMKNCGTTVQNALREVAGVSQAVVLFEEERAVVRGTLGTLSIQSLIEAVEDVGFEATEYSKRPSVEQALLLAKPMTKRLKSSDNATEETGLIVDIVSSLPRAYFEIDGMSCASCVKSIENILMGVGGISDCRVGLISKKAEVAFDRTVMSEQKIQSYIEDAGYGAKYLYTSDAMDDSIEIRLNIQGMSCSACVVKVETMIKKLPGVLSVAVNLPLAKATVELERMANTGPRTLVECIHQLGYAASIATKQLSAADLQRSMNSEVQHWRRLLLISLAFSLPATIIHHLLSNIYPTKEWLRMSIMNNLTWECFLMYLLATPIQFGIGKRFYVAAYKGLKHGMMGMDFLIVVGTTSSYLYSFLSMILGALNPEYHGRYFFESSAMLITFVTFGKFLEAVAKGRTADALKDLLSLQPKVAVLVEEADSNKPRCERDIPIEMVQRGDLLKVVPGSSIPTDGVIVSGSTTLDESMITGESMPVAKTVGDYVFGSTMNQHGAILMQVKSVGSESALSQICHLIEDAQVSKAPIQMFADKIAGIFAPFVIILALLTFITWYGILSAGLVPQSWRYNIDQDNFLFSLLFSISVVVIACPCALGLATPTAVMVGCGVGAKNGILIKGGHALETAHRVDTVVFDKTGTLTLGRPTVTDVLVMSPTWTARDLLYFIASAETASDHPLGKAIVLAATEQEQLKLVSPTHFHIVPGRGLQCNVDGQAVVVGNVQWLESQGFNVIPLAVEKAMHAMENEGKTVVCVGIEGRWVGLVALADTLRPEAKLVVDALHAMHLEVWMITGDNLRTASAIARTLGIDHVQAVALPGEKVSQIRALQARKRTVAMVGDGINDAPALAQADVGLAIGAGTDIALAQADMILVKSNLCDVVTALDLARVVYARIRLNFFFSMAYNFLGIPVAAGLFFPLTHATLPPACAGLAMALSSVSVVVSSLMLKRYEPPHLLLLGGGEAGKKKKTTMTMTTKHQPPPQRQPGLAGAEGGKKTSAKFSVELNSFPPVLQRTQNRYHRIEMNE